ncbi:MAG: hypothetical protein KAS47_04195 [Candidatus Heimdallarchaeota archaeon]|nr:hypothetical protein [Candidatus Heimdallarchaeota archaeon]MCK4972876.1 hypothetical protein [Candidatus Heimdallarchaeota archaeon]MCK5142017.1 hypothetical protein [Candidatus Heimdallarchaeota archaeon]
MYETKIPGTRYSIALMNDKGQWMIQIKLDGLVEAETLVKDVSERGIFDNIKSVVSEVNLYLNEFLLDQITKNITEQASILLKEVVATASRDKQTEVSALEETIISMMERLQILEERVKRLETNLDHQTA